METKKVRRRVKLLTDPSDAILTQHENAGWMIVHEQFVVVEGKSFTGQAKERAVYCCRMVHDGGYSGRAMVGESVGEGLRDYGLSDGQGVARYAPTEGANDERDMYEF